MSKSLLTLVLASTLFVGCSDSGSRSPAKNTASPANSRVPELLPSPDPPADDPEAVKALEEIGATTKTSGDGNIREVNLRSTDATDAILEHVAKLPDVRSILLNDLPITDDGLKHLAGCAAPLSNLDLRGCPVSNDGLQHISGLKSLRALRLNGVSGETTVDDGGMEHVAGLKLKVLALDGLWVSEVGLEAIGEQPYLEELYLKSTTISDDGLKLLAKYPKLKKLRLAFNQISDEGLSHLSGISTLEELDLSENSSLTDAGMTHLSSLTALKKLNLWRVAVSDVGVEKLAPLVNLEWLNLDNTQLSDSGLPSLKNMTKLSFLHVGSTTVSDAGLVHFEGLKALKDLKVTRTAVTEAGVEALQPKLPDTSIQLLYIDGQ